MIRTWASNPEWKPSVCVSRVCLLPARAGPIAPVPPCARVCLRVCACVHWCMPAAPLCVRRRMGTRYCWLDTITRQTDRQTDRRPHRCCANRLHAAPDLVAVGAPLPPSAPPEGPLTQRRCTAHASAASPTARGDGGGRGKGDDSGWGCTRHRGVQSRFASEHLKLSHSGAVVCGYRYRRSVGHCHNRYHLAINKKERRRHLKRKITSSGNRWVYCVGSLKRTGLGSCQYHDKRTLQSHSSPGLSAVDLPCLAPAFASGKSRASCLCTACSETRLAPLAD